MTVPFAQTYEIIATFSLHKMITMLLFINIRKEGKGGHQKHEGTILLRSGILQGSSFTVTVLATVSRSRETVIVMGQLTFPLEYIEAC